VTRLAPLPLRLLLLDLCIHIWTKISPLCLHIGIGGNTSVGGVHFAIGWVRGGFWYRCTSRPNFTPEPEARSTITITCLCLLCWCAIGHLGLYYFGFEFNRSSITKDQSRRPRAASRRVYPAVSMVPSQGLFPGQPVFIEQGATWDRGEVRVKAAPRATAADNRDCSHTRIGP